jgi:hypothetical protein
MSLWGKIKGLFVNSYSEYTIEGIKYRVAAGSNYEVALRLHELNTLTIEIISFIRDLLVSGKVELGIRDRLQVMYERLRWRYDPDQVYESLRDGDDTSFIINAVSPGEQFHACVQVDGISENREVLITVLAHELSHVASETPEHDEDFWENYSVMRRVISLMGLISPKAVPKGSTMHCGRVEVRRDEVMSLASMSGYVPAWKVPGTDPYVHNQFSRDVPPLPFAPLTVYGMPGDRRAFEIVHDGMSAGEEVLDGVTSYEEDKSRPHLHFYAPPRGVAKSAYMDIPVEAHPDESVILSERWKRPEFRQSYDDMPPEGFA